MRVKNKYTSHIGFGTIRILPGETAELPRGYGADHPTVKFYISRGWLEIVGGKTEGEASSVTVNVGIKPLDDDNGNTGGNGNEKTNSDNGEKENEEDGGNATADVSKPDKPISRLNVDELKAYAKQLGLEFADTDTRNMLIDKINAALKPTE
ncbi:hypothetical protein AGMMS49975_09040 [Clostridia bacterium]|nr:hypothetical protein AGMMS49975_09040 [Clostridia bacterium]